MFVSCPPSVSTSRSFRFLGEVECDVLVDIDIVELDKQLSAGETVPDWFLRWSEGALDCALTGAEGLDIGGRIECFLFARPEAGRGIPAIDSDPAATALSRDYDNLRKYISI